MSDNTEIEVKPEVEYIFAFVTEGGNIMPHFAYNKYKTVSDAKRDTRNVLRMVPEELRKLNKTYICEVTTSYKIIQSV